MLRDLHGVRQADLARAAGLQRTSIANLEAGRQNVPVATLLRIAAELQTTVGTLLGETPMPDLPIVRVTAVFTVDCSRCGQIAEVSDQLEADRHRSAHIRNHADRPEEVGHA